jgi:hypothetical protein
MYEGLDPRHEIDFVHVPLAGDGIEIDCCAAAEYYQKASEQEYKSGTSSLARMYEYGLGVEQSFTEAERLLQLAGDHDDAKLRLAHFYEHGRAGAIAKDEFKAFVMYEELVDFTVDFYDDKRASCRLACMYRDGRGVPQNRSRAYDILNNEEVSQNANVCYPHASMLLEEAQGPLRDTPKAMRLLKIAVLKDHTDAHYLLGRQLEDKRPRRAIKLLKKASRKHHVEVTYEMHECGNGVAQNIEIAVMLFTLAAEIPELNADLLVNTGMDAVFFKTKKRLSSCSGWLLCRAFRRHSTISLACTCTAMEPFAVAQKRTDGSIRLQRRGTQKL